MIEPEINKAEVKVDLGCGSIKATGWIGIDKFSHGNVVDQVMDLDNQNVKLPFDDNSVDQIRASHFLEHIHNLIPLINECYRILKAKATFDIIVPSGFTAAFGDPSHVRAFTEETFHYFTSNPPGNYHNPEIKGKWKILLNDWTPSLQEDSEKIVFHKRRELHIILQPEKEVVDETGNSNSNVEQKG